MALALRFSRWGYAFVNTAHVLGIALLVGAIIPLDLRLLGFWSSVKRAALIRVLVPVATVGLALAVTAGFLLFSVRAIDYAALSHFRIKLLLILAGSGSALSLHYVHGRLLETASRTRLAQGAALSMTCWIGALIAGRMIAFVGD
ncbi:MAG: hypothetical protein ACR2RE_29635 [Geminicoccaceae bacterium]